MNVGHRNAVTQCICVWGNHCSRLKDMVKRQKTSNKNGWFIAFEFYLLKYDSCVSKMSTTKGCRRVLFFFWWSHNKCLGCWLHPVSFVKWLSLLQKGTSEILCGLIAVCDFLCSARRHTLRGYFWCFFTNKLHLYFLHKMQITSLCTMYMKKKEYIFCLLRLDDRHPIH